MLQSSASFLYQSVVDKKEQRHTKRVISTRSENFVNVRGGVSLLGGSIMMIQHSFVRRKDFCCFPNFWIAVFLWWVLSSANRGPVNRSRASTKGVQSLTITMVRRTTSADADNLPYATVPGMLVPVWKVEYIVEFVTTWRSPPFLTFDFYEAVQPHNQYCGALCVARRCKLCTPRYSLFLLPQ